MAEAEFAAHGDPPNFINDIYSCAIDPQGWPAVLRECARRVGGCAASILRISGENPARPEAEWSIDRKFARAMRTAAARMASLSALCLRLKKPFAVRGVLGVLGDADRSDFRLVGKNFLPKHIADIAVIPLTREAKVVSVLIVLRPKEAGTFQPDEIGAIAAMSPHFRRAAAISNLLEFKPLGKQRSVGSFNRMPMAFILTDGAGRILYANAAAADMLDGCPLLCLEDELAARDGRSDAALRGAITNAAETDRGTEGSRPKMTSLVVTGPGSRAIEVWVIPVAEHFGPPASSAGSARVAIFARALDTVAEERKPADATQTVAATFGGSRRDGAVDSGQRLVALLTQALRKPARYQSRPRSALSELSVVRRAKAAAPARASTPEL